MAEKLSESEDEALGGRIHGGVGGEHVDVKGLETHPQRVGRIGEAAVGEGVGGEEVAELVVDAGDGDGKPREECEAEENGTEEEQGEGGGTPGGEAGKG
jgi:hypothetical protein